MKSTYTVTAIAAISKDRRALGKNNDLLWKIPGDLPRFKRLTVGHPVIMGDKTFESLPGLLSGRTNIIMSLEPDFEIDGALIAHSPEEALKTAQYAPGSEKIFIIGGGTIYKVMLPYTDELDLTIVDDEPEADVFFPSYETDFVCEKEEDRQISDGLSFVHTHWIRA